MTDTSLPPDVQAKLDEIKAEAADRAAKAEAAAATERQRLDALDAAKAVCEEKCGPIAEAIAASTGTERAALETYQAETHAEHADALAAAYRTFAGQGEGESNPADPGVAPITSDISVAGGAEA